MNNQDFNWPEGKRCAVSLTYDDGLPVHYTLVGPLLESEGLRGTFFVNALSDVLYNPDNWKKLAARGHELGNHSLFHPCRREPAERFGWLDPHYDLSKYTPRRWEEELSIANLLLQLLDGRGERTYGNTCCNTSIGSGGQEVSMDAILQERFIAARGSFTNRIAYPARGINLMQVGHFGGDGKSFADIKQLIEEAERTGGWIVWMFHGVGQGTHDMNIAPAEHERLVRWLGRQQETIWTVPFIEAARHVKSRQT